MGGSTSAILGNTNHFFVPWLIPRNDRNSVYAPNFLGKLAGRTGRSIVEPDKSDLFTMRIQFCEEKVVSCLDKEEEWEESVNEYNGKFSRCQPVFHECLKDHLLVAGDRP